MGKVREEVIDMLNNALKLEHAAINQYLSHAEQLTGPYAEKQIERIKEIAGDEMKHADIFRSLIGAYLNAEVTMEMGGTKKGGDLNKILEVNLASEKEAIDFYKLIYRKVVDNKDEFKYEFETLEHQIRHVIIDEQEHVTELSLLMGK